MLNKRVIGHIEYVEKSTLPLRTDEQIGQGTDEEIEITVENDRNIVDYSALLREVRIKVEQSDSDQTFDDETVVKTEREENNYGTCLNLDSHITVKEESQDSEVEGNDSDQAFNDQTVVKTEREDNGFGACINFDSEITVKEECQDSDSDFSEPMSAGLETSPAVKKHGGCINYSELLRQKFGAENTEENIQNMRDDCGNESIVAAKKAKENVKENHLDPVIVLERLKDCELQTHLKVSDIPTSLQENEVEQEEESVKSRKKPKKSKSKRPRLSPSMPKHLKICADSVICSICDKFFASKSNLNKHMRIHMGQKPVPCPKCKKDFIDQGQLNRHLRIHSGEKPFVCSFCKKGFVDSTQLKRHEWTHTGEKPYACSICDKWFSQTGSLNIHIRIHTGEKPFACSLCSKSFRNRNHLNIHMRNHTGERPFACTFCSKSYAQSGNLKLHLKRRHSDKK